MDLSIVTKYLDEYSGERYRAPENAPDTKKQYYYDFYKAGREAREEYKKYCKRLCAGNTEIEMDGKSPSGWKSTWHYVDEYFWSRFKTKRHDDYINNIAITINKMPELSETWTLGVYVGVDYKKASQNPSLFRKQNHLLDLEIPESKNFYYLVKTTNDIDYTCQNRDEVRKRFIEGKVKVVSLLKVIDGPYIEERSDIIIKDSRQAVKEFIPYYEYIMGENYTMSGWEKQ